MREKHVSLLCTVKYECCSWTLFAKTIVKFCIMLDQERAHSL